MAKKSKKAKKILTEEKLTGKELSFCEYFVILHNGAKSYREAGYACTKDSAVKAYRLLSKGHIQRYIAHLKRERSMAMKMKADDVYDQLQMIACEPYEKTSDRLKALELIGKTHKMYIDKIDLDANHKHTGKTEAEIMEELNKLKDKRKYDEL